jgi:hypothetical protein
VSGRLCFLGGGGIHRRCWAAIHNRWRAGMSTPCCTQRPPHSPLPPKKAHTCRILLPPKHAQLRAGAVRRPPPAAPGCRRRRRPPSLRLWRGRGGRRGGGCGTRCAPAHRVWGRRGRRCSLLVCVGHGAASPPPPAGGVEGWRRQQRQCSAAQPCRAQVPALLLWRLLLLLLGWLVHVHGLPAWRGGGGACRTVQRCCLLRAGMEQRLGTKLHLASTPGISASKAGMAWELPVPARRACGLGAASASKAGMAWELPVPARRAWPGSCQCQQAGQTRRRVQVRAAGQAGGRARQLPGI